MVAVTAMEEDGKEDNEGGVEATKKPCWAGLGRSPEIQKPRPGELQRGGEYGHRAVQLCELQLQYICRAQTTIIKVLQWRGFF